MPLQALQNDNLLSMVHAPGGGATVVISSLRQFPRAQVQIQIMSNVGAFGEVDGQMWEKKNKGKG